MVTIFLTGDDHRFYRAIVREKSQMFGLSNLGLRLMRNPGNVIGISMRSYSFAKALGQVHATDAADTCGRTAVTQAPRPTANSPAIIQWHSFDAVAIPAP